MFVLNNQIQFNWQDSESGTALGLKVLSDLRHVFLVYLHLTKTQTFHKESFCCLNLNTDKTTTSLWCFVHDNVRTVLLFPDKISNLGVEIASNVSLIFSLSVWLTLPGFAVTDGALKSKRRTIIIQPHTSSAVTHHTHAHLDRSISHSW